MEYVEKNGLNINKAYTLSWDDKYGKLCANQNIERCDGVTFDKEISLFNEI